MFENRVISILEGSRVFQELVQLGSDKRQGNEISLKEKVKKLESGCLKYELVVY